MFVEDLLSKHKDGPSYSLFLRRTLTQIILLLPQEMMKKLAEFFGVDGEHTGLAGNQIQSQMQACQLP